jgi:hypothetical protein
VTTKKDGSRAGSQSEAKRRLPIYHASRVKSPEVFWHCPSRIVRVSHCLPWGIWEQLRCWAQLDSGVERFSRAIAPRIGGVA